MGLDYDTKSRWFKNALFDFISDLDQLGER
jgi:hypothetical protein